MNITDIQNIFTEAEEKISQASDSNELDEIKHFYLGRKGKMAQVIKQIPELPEEKRPLAGKESNIIKGKIQSLLSDRTQQLKTGQEKTQKIDTSLPAVKRTLGGRHPITIVIDDICKIFEHIGFTLVEGPEIETDYYNFKALNIPEGHPARDNFATFYLPKDNMLLRSQTSPVQIRIMKDVEPPLRILSPGKVFRPDNLDASHSFMFHQIEGLVVDKKTNFTHLKASLSYFVKNFFGRDVTMRFRPHYFPFTEPSAEVDIACIICGGEGCSVCSRTGWLEILGAGMVHPNVLKEVGIEESIFQGYAFGLGIERIAMLKYGITDIRMFFNNDMRFLKQFS
ncbi:MAG: phenylalanine--tRNA ligase subunit alpha [Candidatus Saelkia tenebricola]|nr:phenylalanine--tRNA ligase subunit alpha [Candidatus Saelkia tenebricola]